MAHAEIHEYTTKNVTDLDEFGEPRLGFYYRIIDDLGSIKFMMGPYSSAAEAEEAAHDEWAVQ